MTALDTNVIVRVITRDNTKQAERAARLMKSQRLWLPKTVLLETEWVLRYTYGFEGAAIHKALSVLIALENLDVEDAANVRRALAWLAVGMDFADALHLASSERATSFVTFDRVLAKRATRASAAPAVELLTG